MANLATALFGIASAERLIGVMPRVMISFRNCRLLVVLALWAMPYSTYAGGTIDLHELDSLFSAAGSNQGAEIYAGVPCGCMGRGSLGISFQSAGWRKNGALFIQGAGSKQQSRSRGGPLYKRTIPQLQGGGVARITNVRSREAGRAFGYAVTARRFYNAGSSVLSPKSRNLSLQTQSVDMC